MYVGIPRVHRWLYLIGAGLIVVGLAALGVAVSAGEPAGTSAILAGVCLLGGLIAVWAGLKLRGVVEHAQESLSQGLAALGGSQGSPFGGVHVSSSGDVDLDVAGLLETLAQAGINLDPRLFEDAHVSHGVQSIAVSADRTSEDALQRDGRRGTATIDSLQPFMQLGEHTVAAVALQVTLDGESASYPATVNGLVPQAVASRVTPGMQVPVLVSADDPNQILVDWARA